LARPPTKNVVAPCALRDSGFSMTVWSHETRARAFQYVSILIFVASLLVGAAFVYWVGPSYLIQQALITLPDDPGWGWFAGWGLLLMVAVVFFFPLWQAIMAASGLMFGLFWGSALNFVGLYAASLICLVLGRTLLQEPIRTWLEEGYFPTARHALQVLEEADDSTQFLVLFRFLYIPIWFRNYAPATLHIPLWKLLVTAIPHTFWVSFMFASLGLSLQDANNMVSHGEKFEIWDAKWQHIAMFVVSSFMALLLSWYAYRKYAEVMHDEGKPLNANAKREP